MFRECEFGEYRHLRPRKESCLGTYRNHHHPSEPNCDPLSGINVIHLETWTDGKMRRLPHRLAFGHIRSPVWCVVCILSLWRREGVRYRNVLHTLLCGVYRETTDESSVWLCDWEFFLIDTWIVYFREVFLHMCVLYRCVKFTGVTHINTIYVGPKKSTCDFSLTMD